MVKAINIVKDVKNKNHECHSTNTNHKHRKRDKKRLYIDGKLET